MDTTENTPETESALTEKQKMLIEEYSKLVPENRDRAIAYFECVNLFKKIRALHARCEDISLSQYLHE